MFDAEKPQFEQSQSGAEDLKGPEKIEKIKNDFIDQLAKIDEKDLPGKNIGKMAQDAIDAVQKAEEEAFGYSHLKLKVTKTIEAINNTRTKYEIIQNGCAAALDRLSASNSAYKELVNAANQGNKSLDNVVMNLRDKSAGYQDLKNAENGLWFAEGQLKTMQGKYILINKYLSDINEPDWRHIKLVRNASRQIGMCVHMANLHCQLFGNKIRAGTLRLAAAQNRYKADSGTSKVEKDEIAKLHREANGIDKKADQISNDVNKGYSSIRDASPEASSGDTGVPIDSEDTSNPSGLIAKNE